MEKCPNCRQPVLPDDVFCWRCGTRLPLVQEEEEEPHLGLTWFEDGGGIAADIQKLPGAPVVYGFVTVVLIVLLWITWRLLAAAPLAQVSFGDLIPVGFRVVTAADRRFTFNLSRQWQTFDKISDPDGLAVFLAGAPALFQDALRPLSLQAEDLEIIFAAHGGERFSPLESGFLLVARSARLNRLSPGMAEVAARQARWLPLTRVEIVEDAGKSHLRIDFFNQPADPPADIIVSGIPVSCSQQFVPGARESLLLTVCSPNRSGAGVASLNDRAVRDGVMESFEYLGRENRE